MDYLDETMPYKKKSKRRAPAKAKHIYRRGKNRAQPRHENSPYISPERHLDTEVCRD